MQGKAKQGKASAPFSSARESIIVGFQKAQTRQEISKHYKRIDLAIRTVEFRTESEPRLHMLNSLTRSIGVSQQQAVKLETMVLFMFFLKNSYRPGVQLIYSASGAARLFLKYVGAYQPNQPKPSQANPTSKLINTFISSSSERASEQMIEFSFAVSTRNPTNR